MKALLLITFLVFTLKSWAVVTKDCPDLLFVELKNVHTIDIKSEELEDDLSYERALREVSDLNSHIAQLKLENTEKSSCEYVGKGPYGKYLSIKLEGSLRPNAKKPARAVYSIGNDFVLFIGIQKISPEGIIASENEKIKIFYPGQSCYYGCSLKYIPMAIVEKININ